MSCDIVPLATVIIPTFNRPQYLFRAVKSVLEQTLTDYECLIIDDNSASPVSDNAELINLLSGDSRFIIHRNKANLHVSESRNIGLKHSRGKYISFLDDDDYWFPSKLQRQISYMEQNSVYASYCWTQLITADGLRLMTSQHHGNIFNLLLARQCIGNISTFMYNKHALPHGLSFNKRLLRGNDGDFIRQVSWHTPIGLLAEPLVYYQVNTMNTNITSNDRTGLLRSLRSLRYRRAKYREILSLQPLVDANIRLQISSHYAKLGSKKYALLYLLSAMRETASQLLRQIKPLLSVFYRIFTP